jgi:hypothetical protein
MDYSGNFSVTTNVYFQYVVSNQLGLRAAGLGAINPNYSNAWLEIGRNYNITSTPASGFKFVNWVVSTNWGGGVVVSTTNLQFMMASNLTLQAILVDTAKPTLTITAPTAGQKMSNALALVRGTAADNWHLSNVWYRLNSNSWNLATTTNGFTNWYTPTLTLTAGTNSVNAYALDLAGNLSTTGSVSFFSSNTFKLQMSFAATQPLTSTGLNLSVQLSSGLSGQVQVSTNLLNWQSLTNFSGTNTTLKIIDHQFRPAVLPGGHPVAQAGRNPARLSADEDGAGYGVSPARAPASGLHPPAIAGCRRPPPPGRGPR